MENQQVNVLEINTYNAILTSVKKSVAYKQYEINCSVARKVYLIYCLYTTLFFFHPEPVCQMNKNFNQTAGQVAHKSYPSSVVRATDIAMEAYNNSH